VFGSNNRGKHKDFSMNALTDFIALVGRILLAFIFVQAGYNKLTGGIAGTVTNMTNHGIPLADILVWGAIAVELGGGLLLMAGLLARWAALALAAYTTALALIFHAYWLAPAAELRADRALFYNHLAIIGGMLVVVAFGAGYYSLDALMQRRSKRTPDAMRHAVAHR
jgi:putative oxidoreductase